jgi:pyridoxine/pyridoxamine 5'-phosphate oxidase
VSSISEALAASLAGASSFAQSLFADDSWTAPQVSGFVNERRNATIATTNANGQPHAAVVIAASVDDGIYFTVAPQSVLARNLADNARIAFTICDSAHAVMGQGTGVRVGPALELQTLVDDLATASAAGRFTPDGWDGDIYQIDIRRIFAN